MVDIIPITMQGAGIAGITLFISLFAIIYPKSESENAKEILENHILFKEVFLIKYFIIIIPGIYAPFLLWDIEPIRIILFIISAIFIFILFKIIFNMIRWIFTGAENDIDGDVDSDDENYKNKLIKKFLTSIEESNKAPKFYAALFGKKYTDNQAYTEVKYFNYFLEFLDKIYEKEKNQLSADQYEYISKSIFMKSLGIYDDLMTNRNLSNSLLLRHFTKKWIKKFFQYYDKKMYLHPVVDIIRKHIEAYCKAENGAGLSSLIFLIKDGIKKKEEKKTIAFFRYCIMDIFFAEPKIWQRNLFPEEWKYKIGEKENIYAVQWFQTFWDKSLQRPQDYDDIKEVEHQQSILEGIFFDEIDPEIFSYFYRIINPDYNRMKNRDIASKHYMKWLVEEYKYDFYTGAKPSLYYIGRHPANESSSPPTQEKTLKIMNKRIKKMEQTAFKFFCINKGPSEPLQSPAVKKYINQLRELNYDKEKNPEEAYRSYRKERLLYILNEWLEYCKKKDKEKQDKAKSGKQLVEKE